MFLLFDLFAVANATGMTQAIPCRLQGFLPLLVRRYVLRPDGIIVSPCKIVKLQILIIGMHKKKLRYENNGINESVAFPFCAAKHTPNSLKEAL